MKKILIILSLTIFPSAAIAQNITATELQKNCTEVKKGSIGQKFDHELASICTGYLDGFFDSAIIVNKFAGGNQFCIPKSLKDTKGLRILDEWIKQNSKIAERTTASVALFAAMKKAFPCANSQKVTKRVTNPRKKVSRTVRTKKYGQPINDIGLIKSLTGAF